MKEQNLPWDAISARLKGVGSPEQDREIQEWLDSSAEHAVFLSEILDVWSVTKNKTDFYQPDLSLNWGKLMSKINNSSRENNFRTIFLRWTAAAAVLLLIFFAGTKFSADLFNLKSKITYTKIIVPQGNKTQVVLPDSTCVWLNSGSEIQYASNYSSTNRKVKMKGECFFDVVKDPIHPFLVQGSKFQVKVFGTRFNVNENLAKNTADITLVSGKIQVLDLRNNPVYDLLPGQQLVCSKEGVYQVGKAKNIEALTAWLNNMLIFDNQPFEEVIPYLEKWYGVKIHLDHTLYYRHNYTFKVKTESFREVLELISVITPIEYQIAGEQVTIKYIKKMK
jgi:transmembrane sensor